jgi:hypothetical protein
MNPVTGAAVTELREVPTTGRLLAVPSDNLQLVGGCSGFNVFLLFCKSGR